MQPGTPARQPDGSLLPTYSEVFKVWAEIEQIRANEVLRMGIQDGVVVKRIKIRPRDGLSASMVADYGTRRFHFITIDELQEAGREMWITAEERLRA